MVKSHCLFDRMPAPGIHPKPVVLVVDTSRNAKRGIKDTLCAGGFEVLLAENGAEALRLVESILPDVVLLDANIEDMAGFEVCRRLRAGVRTRAMPVIMMSALVDGDVVAKVFAAGAVDFLTKPFRGEELCARVAVHAELNRARCELEESHARLAELNAEKDQMFGVPPHDLRGPLGATIGFADPALNAPGHAEATLERHALEIVRREARQMNQYLEELLDLNALERGGVRMHPRALGLHDLVMAALERHGPAARAKDITLRGGNPGIDVPMRERLRVRADPAFLRQVLDNYLSNAIKFTPPGGAVTLRLAERDGEVHVMVCDTGPGLSAADMAVAFKRFARLSAQPTSGEKSTGLGLAICLALVNRMGGRVWCGNNPSGGGCFGFALPVFTAEMVPAPDASLLITHPHIARDIVLDSVPPFLPGKVTVGG